jgi:tellurite resistance protein TerC
MSTPLSHWIGFHIGLVLLLGIELTFSRWNLPRTPSPARSERQHKNAIAATAMWVSVALLFAVYVWRTNGGPLATQFLAGYAIEESLSIDNLFVFLLLFRVFSIPDTRQPRVLFWGVAGAIVMRGAFIAAGLGLLERFHWIEYVFALVLLAAAVRLVLPEDKQESGGKPKPPAWVRWISRIHPVSLSTDTFFTTEQGTRMVTMLFLSLLAIETTDIVFALDSIPAVLSITREPFLAYTSNILAVMGLRSLFFLLARALQKLRFLHYGLAAVLFFAGIKMLASDWFNAGPLLSLGIIVGILGVTIAVSLLKPQPAKA